ncbi:hypothetical protein TWF694_001153 [Orbilia ellipsospora]|uniref:CCHC-type domain-containing protein n=1 Tax=Orbilia ellipsospora TaxID=2528407 RepID=A0AAV9XXD8_9PEZI
MSGYCDECSGLFYSYYDSDEDMCMYDAPKNGESSSKFIGEKNPKASKASAGKPTVKKCRTCGNSGHDSRNCAVNKGFTAKKKEKETRKVSASSKSVEAKACGACREIGHDRRSCLKLLGSISQQKQKNIITNTVKKVMKTMTTPTKSPAKSKANVRKPSTPLGARGSKGGDGVSKKAGGKAKTKKTTISKSVKKNMNSINLTLNLGKVFSK